MASTRGRSWKLERASATVRGKIRPRSNKYARSDSDEKPGPGKRSRVWIGGYVRSDGRKVAGYYRSVPRS